MAQVPRAPHRRHAAAPGEPHPAPRASLAPRGDGDVHARQRAAAPL